MKQRPIQRGFALMSIVALVGLAAACVPPSGPATGNFSFSATSVTVNASNDKTCVFGLCVNTSDEPYVINVGFTVQIGVANSATDSVVVGDVAPSTGEGSTHTFTGGEQGTINFPNVPLLDVADLLNTNNHLEIAGVWSWAMESDLFGVSGLATTAGDAIKTALNSTLAAGSLPSDPSQIVSSILGVLGSNLFPALGGLIGSVIPFAGDDAIGSQIYIGLGVTGTLKTVIDAATAGATFPSLAIPVLSVPPDIDGGAIFSLGNQTLSNQVMTNGGVQGQHTYTYTLAQS
jgi:hypothetical protein